MGFNGFSVSLLRGWRSTAVGGDGAWPIAIKQASRGGEETDGRGEVVEEERQNEQGGAPRLFFFLVWLERDRMARRAAKKEIKKEKSQRTAKHCRHVGYTLLQYCTLHYGRRVDGKTQRNAGAGRPDPRPSLHAPIRGGLSPPLFWTLDYASSSLAPVSRPGAKLQWPLVPIQD